MSLKAASSKIWFNLPLYSQQHLLLLREVKYYFTVEPVILRVLITILNTYLPNRNYTLDTMLQSLDIAQRYGWLAKEPLPAMIKIHPLFACFLHAQATESTDEKTTHCFMEFYSAYANYILEQYLQSGKDELRLEGFKVVFFEFFNFERALYHAIATQDDFLHIYHLLDHTLDANEDHLNRLHFTKKLIRFAEKFRFDNEMFYLQYIQLQSFLADIHYRLGDYPEAERLYRSALDIFRTNSAYQESAMVLANLANLLSDQGRYEPAIAYYKEAIDLVEQHAAPDERMESVESTLQKTWQNLGLCYYQNRQLNEAKAALQQSRHYARADADEFAEAMVNFHLAQIEQRLDNRRHAAKLYTQAVEVYQRHAFDFGIAEINQQMGMLLMESGKPELAQKSYQMALELFLSLDLPRNVAQIYNNLAFVAYQTAQFAEARDYYARGLEISRSCLLPQVEISCLIGLGAVALEFNQLYAGENYLRQALDIVIQFNDPGSLAIIAFNRAKIEQQRGRYRQSLVYANEALEYYRQLNEVNNIRAAEALIAALKGSIATTLSE